MKHLTKILIVTQTLTLVGLGFALVAAYGPPSEDEMRRTLFYMNGRTSALVMDLDVETKEYTTCMEAVAHYDETSNTGADWAKPKSEADREAFLLGCKEALLTNKYGK
jgi:hypothetical protein